MAVVIPIEHHPHSAHDRTKEWNSCCYEIAMGRDPKRQRLMVHDDNNEWSSRNWIRAKDVTYKKFWELMEETITNHHLPF